MATNSGCPKWAATGTHTGTPCIFGHIDYDQRCNKEHCTQGVKKVATGEGDKDHNKNNKVWNNWNNCFSLPGIWLFEANSFNFLFVSK